MNRNVESMLADGRCPKCGGVDMQQTAIADTYRSADRMNRADCRTCGWRGTWLSRPYDDDQHGPRGGLTRKSDLRGFQG